MTFSRNVRRAWLAGTVLVAAILCQGQMCASVNTFKVVGEPDPTMDGDYALVINNSGTVTNTAVTLGGGIPTTLGVGDSLSILDGASHANPKKQGSTYTGSGDAGRVGADFTMQIDTVYAFPGDTPSSVTQKMTFTGTVDANGVVTGSGTQTISAPGYANNVANFTFTMTK